jgi:cell wall-associated NlpC family hydrolase
MTDHQEKRRAVVNEARTWIKTPYHHMGRVKGKDGGIDCATFLLEVYERAGLIEHIETGNYSPDWYLHRDEEKYLEWILRFGVRVDHDWIGGRDEFLSVAIASEPLLADVILFRFGRCIAHGAIVTEWPMIIHSFRPIGMVVEENIDQNNHLRHIVPGGYIESRFSGVFRFKDWVSNG